VTYDFSITGIDSQTGSLAGGRQIKLSGTGLANLEDNISIKFCDTVCDVVSDAANSGNEITCQLQALRNTYSTRNDGTQPCKQK